jgi:hypothetical protein
MKTAVLCTLQLSNVAEKTLGKGAAATQPTAGTLRRGCYRVAAVAMMEAAPRAALRRASSSESTSRSDGGKLPSPALARLQIPCAPLSTGRPDE